MTTKLERIVELEPAFDKRHADPSKNYGIHGVTLKMVLKGDAGAVQFLLFTNWQLPHVTEESIEATLEGIDKIGLKVRWQPMPADLGYHSKKPRYEGHEPMGSTKVKWVDPPESYRDQPFLKDLKRVPKSEPTGTFDPCPYTDGGPCYYDGSGLNAERIFDVLLKEGSEGVWRELEAYYHSIFDEVAA